MLYTLTLNPSLDYHLSVNELTIGGLNRAQTAVLRAGGKGINTAQVLSALGLPHTALLATAGQTGNLLCSLLGGRIDYKALPILVGQTRINVKLDTGEITEINAAGPALSPAKLPVLFDALDCLCEGDWLVLSGRPPQGAAASLYQDILEFCHQRGARTVLDSTGEAFLQALAASPFLVKPNEEELAALTALPTSTTEQVLAAAQALQRQGAKNVLVSRGERGAVLAVQDGSAFSLAAPEGKAVQTVGAGDSMVAGFLWADFCGRGFSDALRFAVAAGSAAAFSPSLPRAAQIKQILGALGTPTRLA